MPERGRTIRLTRAGWLLPVERTRLQGTLLAVDEINAAGGIPDLPLVPVRYGPERVLPELYQTEFAALQGRVRIDRERNHTGCGTRWRASAARWRRDGRSWLRSILPM
jgi:hypothetical protein